MSTQTLDQVHSKFENVGQLKVKDLCETVDEPSVADITKYVPEVIAFNKAGVPNRVIEILPLMEKFHNSFVFMKMWHSTCNSVQKLIPSLEDVVEQIWEPVYKK